MTQLAADATRWKTNSSPFDYPLSLEGEGYACPEPAKGVGVRVNSLQVAKLSAIPSPLRGRVRPVLSLPKGWG